MNQSDNLVEIRGLSFRRGDRVIFDDLSLQFPRGKVTAINGPSGIGEIWVDGDNVPTLSRRRLYEVCKN